MGDLSPAFERSVRIEQLELSVDAAPTTAPPAEKAGMADGNDTGMNKSLALMIVAVLAAVQMGWCALLVSVVVRVIDAVR
jgi:hypothetical protein